MGSSCSSAAWSKRTWGEGGRGRGARAAGSALLRLAAAAAARSPLCWAAADPTPTQGRAGPRGRIRRYTQQELNAGSLSGM